MIGKTLGHFKILEQLGQGGMGEVYLADDTTLNRKVALKFLPQAFTSDPERMARLEREAKLLASLNHPNIAGIYGLEQADGSRFLVLEYVEGETLQARLSKGALPLEDALALCRQIAEGLEAAHEKGVIHRDLKPANVMITGEEKVKILDFGLAKALADESQSTDPSDSPTITEAMTRPGAILGTAAYMSPEEAKGKSVDKRADIWAFGCILYECLTGKKAFEGETVTETLAAILRGDPDWEALPASTPQNIRFVLRRCLNKDKRARIHGAADVRIELSEIQGIDEATILVKRQRSFLAWSIAIGCLIGLLIFAVLYFRQIPVEAPEMRLQVITPPTSEPSSLSLSPDGRYLVFVALADDGQNQLWLRQLDNTTASPLEETKGATYPFWSPDSQSIGFFAERKLKRIDVAGGPAQILADAPRGAGGTWNRDNVIVFAPMVRSQLHRVSASVGEPLEPVSITQLDPPKQIGHLFPQFLPDGDKLLYYSWGSDSGIYLTSLNSAETKRLIPANSAGVYAKSGHLLFIRQDTLFAQRFDTESWDPSMKPDRIIDSVVSDIPFNIPGFSISETGLLAYRTGASANLRRLIWFDRSGNEVSALGSLDENNLLNPELSPKGSHVAVSRNVDQGNASIWTIETKRGVPKKFTHDATPENSAIWSQDGRIAFASFRKNTWGLYKKDSSGVGNAEVLLEEPSLALFPNDWSPDDKFILYTSSDPKTSYDLWVLPLSDPDQRYPFAASEDFDEQNGQFSPDGRWIAYQSNETGIFEIYIQPFPGPGKMERISTNGGIQPRWNPDNDKEIFYITPNGELTSVSIQVTGQTLIPGDPEVLFATRIVGGVTARIQMNQYAVALDGQSFLINTNADESTISPITIITNWTRLLKE